MIPCRVCDTKYVMQLFIYEWSPIFFAERCHIVERKIFDVLHHHETDLGAKQREVK